MWSGNGCNSTFVFNFSSRILWRKKSNSWIQRTLFYVFDAFKTAVDLRINNVILCFESNKTEFVKMFNCPIALSTNYHSSFNFEFSFLVINFELFYTNKQLKCCKKDVQIVISMAPSCDSFHRNPQIEFVQQTVFKISK